MIRLVSAVLVFLLGLAPMAPVLSAGEREARLPACCKRDGQHGCAMNMKAKPDRGGIAFRPAAAKCPYWPQAAPVIRVSEALPASPSAATFGALLAHPTSQPQLEARWRISFSRTCQKRGPPVLL